MKPELKELLHDFIDNLETEFGTLEGFEVKLKHPIVDGANQEHADVEEFNVYYIHKEQIEIAPKKK